MITFNFTIPYTKPPPGTFFTFDFGGVVPSVVFVHSIVVEFVSPVCSVSSTAANLPSGISPRAKTMRWQRATYTVDSLKSFLYAESTIVDNSVDITYQDFDNVDTELEAPYVSKMDFADQKSEIPFANFSNFPRAEVSSPYVSKMDYIDDTLGIPYTETSERYVKVVRSQFKNIQSSGYKDVFKDILYGGKNSINELKTFGFNVPIIVDKSHRNFWGPFPYSLECSRMYFPVTNPFLHFYPGDPLTERIIIELPSLNFEIPYNQRCPFDKEHSGPRDPFPPPPFPPYIPLFPREVYKVSNSVFVKLLPSNTDIEVLSLSLGIDRGSWLWDFTITVPHRQYLDLLRPEAVAGAIVFKDIEININGWVWTCRIEEWSESITFGKRSWTLSGRSPSSELADPHCLSESFIQTSIIQGGQLPDIILTSTGWSVLWGKTGNPGDYSEYMNPILDWAVPADIFSYTEKTKIQGVQQVVEALNGYIQTQADCYAAGNKKLIIMPKYNLNPCDWTNVLDEDVDAEIIHDLGYEINQKFMSNSIIDSVIVSGVNAGVLVNATRQGAAVNTRRAPMFTHPLITTEGIGGECARNILGSTGIWSEHTIRLFSLKTFGSLIDYRIGLILPGNIVKVSGDGTSWKGHAIGTSINVRMGNGVPEVDQTIGIEQYIPI